MKTKPSVTFRAFPSHSKRKPVRVLSDDDRRGIMGDRFKRNMTLKEICAKWHVSSHLVCRICGPKNI